MNDDSLEKWKHKQVQESRKAKQSISKDSRKAPKSIKVG